MAKLEDQLKKLPQKPGVYLFRNKTGTVLYVGKALNIKERVKNYFSSNLKDIRIRNLLNESTKISFIQLKSELESLLYEAKLVKQYKPKYNVKLLDDKRYLYVGITKEKYSLIKLIRQPEKETNLMDWFGPFPSSQSLKEILRLLRRIFPFRTCKNLPVSPCLYFHLKLCPGVCFKPSLVYKSNIENVRSFLNGKIDFLIKKLKKEMITFSKETMFEQAAISRKRIQMIENLLSSYKKFPEERNITKKLEGLRKAIVRWEGIEPFVLHKIETFDVANLSINIVVGSMAVFIDGEPSNSDYRQFKIKGYFKGDPDGIGQIVRRRLNHKEWIYPQAILVDGGKAQVAAAFESLKIRGLADKIGLVGLAKEEESVYIPRIKNGFILSWKQLKFSSTKTYLSLLQFARDEAHRFAQRYYKKLHRKYVLGN